MQQTSNLCLSAHDELYIVHLDRVLYMQAEDHYTHVYYTSGTTFMVPYGLGQVEEAVRQNDGQGNTLLRLGRKYIINTSRIFRISTIRDTLYLSDDHGNHVALHIAKPILRSLINSMKKADAPDDTKPSPNPENGCTNNK